MNPNEHIKLNKGDTLICIDNDVYVADKVNNQKDGFRDQMVKALFKKNFIILNPSIFEKQQTTVKQ